MSVSCLFRFVSQNITFFPIGSTCITVPNPKNGFARKLGVFLQLRCKMGYFFNPSPPGLPSIFQNPFYRCINNKWVSQNDRVSILTRSPDCMGEKKTVLINTLVESKIMTVYENGARALLRLSRHHFSVNDLKSRWIVIVTQSLLFIAYFLFT